MYIVNVPTNQPFVTYAQDCHVMFHLMQHDQHPCLPLPTANRRPHSRRAGGRTSETLGGKGNRVAQAWINERISGKSLNSWGRIHIGSGALSCRRNIAHFTA